MTHSEPVRVTPELLDGEQGTTEYGRFAERLIWHIQEEEEALYPALLLVGEFVKEKLAKAP